MYINQDLNVAVKASKSIVSCKVGQSGSSGKIDVDQAIPNKKRKRTV